MSALNREIKSEDLKIEELVKLLREDKYLIPTFQREFVWDPKNIINLWDSIYRFYPIGSILYWETDSYLHTHRRIGGFVFPHDEDAVRKFKEWRYILDGQQRSTALLVSMLGGRGRVEGNEDFDYTLYFDATDGTFFFQKDLDRRAESRRREFLIRMRDVPHWEFTFYRDISTVKGFTKDIEGRLQQLQRMFTDYRLSVIKIRGVEVNEVCDIFERINQEGKKLDPVDIMVARTYRNEDPVSGRPGFYLRDNLEQLNSRLVEQGNRFQDLEDLMVIQMVAICLRKEDNSPRSAFGITPKALENLTAGHFEHHWEECQKTIFTTIKFLRSQSIHGPAMLPYGYLALSLCFYFHRNPNPNLHIARQWFWRNAFGLDDFRAATDVYRFCDEFFRPLEQSGECEIPRLVLSRTHFVQSSYYYRNAFSRAVLVFLAYQHPVDFTDRDAEVLDSVYLLLSQTPNLHHIYPQNFLAKSVTMPPGITADSLMNICYLRARTNIQIGDENPLSYLRKYEDIHDFDQILESHLIPREFLEREVFRPIDYSDFLFERADEIARRLKIALPDVDLEITD